MTFDIPPEVNKDFVLSRVSEEEIFERYGVKVVNYAFRSPLRPDINPTCSFYRSSKNNRLYLRDWAGHFWGDCFDLIMKMYGIGYYPALKMVAKDFGLIKGTSGVVREPKIPDVKVEVKEVVDIRVKRRNWNQYDAEFWRQYGITRKLLEKFHVSPVEWVWLNGQSNYHYTKPRNIAYCYHFGNYNYKIYLPYRDRMRFIHNDASILQGYDHLPDTGQYLVITKSYKDVIKLYQYGIPSVSPMSETQIISGDTLRMLEERFDYIFALYDHDRTGVRSLIKYKKLGVVPLSFPRDQPKDLTDFYKKYGEEETSLLINTVKDIYL